MKLVKTLLCLTLSLCAFAQQTKERGFREQLVKTTDWGHRCVSQHDTVWTLIRNTVVAQIGEAEFQKARTNSEMLSWPVAMQLPMTKRKDTAYMRRYYEKLGQLKMFKIASYTNTLGPKPTRYSIVRIPYDQNKEWDKNEKWDTIYFIFTDHALVSAPSLSSQKNTIHHSTGPQVEMMVWDQRAIYQNEQVWEVNKNSIIAQIGKDEFENVKAYGNTDAWPGGIQYPLAKKRDSLFMKSYYKKLAQLKMYKIASFVNSFGDGKKKYAILRIPYDRNKDWDMNVKWDTIYFIVEEKYLRLL